MAARGSPLARLGSLPIRAPLSSEDFNNDDDDEDDGETASGFSAYSDEGEEMESGTDTEIDHWAAPVAMPIAQLTGDDEFDSSESLEMVSDEEVSVARVVAFLGEGKGGVFDGNYGDGSLGFQEGEGLEVENSWPKSPERVWGVEGRFLEEDSKDVVLGIEEKDVALTGNLVTEENSEVGILRPKEEEMLDQGEATSYYAPNQNIEACSNGIVQYQEYGAEKAVDDGNQVSVDSELKTNELSSIANLEDDSLISRSTEDVTDPRVTPTNGNSHMADMEGNLDGLLFSVNGSSHASVDSELKTNELSTMANLEDDSLISRSTEDVMDPGVTPTNSNSHMADMEGNLDGLIFSVNGSPYAYVDSELKTNELGTIANLEDDSLISRSTEDVMDPGVTPTNSNSHMADMEENLDSLIFSVNGSSHASSESIDRIDSDSGDDVRINEKGTGKECVDSAALARVMEGATTDSSDSMFSITSPAGLGSSVLPQKPSPLNSSRFFVSSAAEDHMVAGETELDMDEEGKKLHEEIEAIKVKFLRLVHRLGHSPEDGVAAEALYHLSFIEGTGNARDTSYDFGIEKAKKKALQLEMDGKVDVEFACNILVIGKTGVGKSATINSIFGEEKLETNAFRQTTSSLKAITGSVGGIKLHVIDTPGFEASIMDQAPNRKILSTIKKYIKRYPPDVVLYVDRLDTQTQDFNDLPLLRTITSVLDSSIWSNAVVALTHASSAPPEGPLGLTLSYNEYIARRSYTIQFEIQQFASDMHMMNPITLVENHPSCRRNRKGEKVLPNGQRWRTELLLLCYSLKIRSEANALLKLQDPYPGKLFGFRHRLSLLPLYLTNLLQSRPHPKLQSDQGGGNSDSDLDLNGEFGLDQGEEEDDYDQLPPFKPLRKSEIAKLTKEWRMAYFDEYDYRVKLFRKKQLKEKLRRLREIKKSRKSGNDNLSDDGDTEQFHKENTPALVAAPLPEIELPPSFDSENPGYRYRLFEPTSQLMAQPIVNLNSWDHDCGYEGIILKENLAIAGLLPAYYSLQITKNKKDFNIHLDSSACLKHGQSGSTLATFDIQSIGRQLAYTLCCQTKFKSFKNNKSSVGVTATILGDTLATGLKMEEQVSVGKQMSLAVSAGAVRAQGDMAYGANLDACLGEICTCGVSLMKCQNELGLGTNFQSQFSIARNSKTAIRVGLNNNMSGQITVRTSTSGQLQLVLVGIIQIALSFFQSIWHS